MERIICCFFGNSTILENDKMICERIQKKAIELIKNNNVNEFWVGNYGAFDKIAAKAIYELKQKYNICLILIIPYLTNSIRESINDYRRTYDYIQMSEIPKKTPPQYKIIKTNHYMINNSKYMICYVKNEWGNSAKLLDYAKSKKDIEIYNIAEF